MRGVSGVREVVCSFDERSERGGQRSPPRRVRAAARPRRPHLRRQTAQRAQRRARLPLRSLTIGANISDTNILHLRFLKTVTK